MRPQRYFKKVDYAKRIGKSKSAISKAIKNGKITPAVRQGKEMIDAIEADAYFNPDPKSIAKYNEANNIKPINGNGSLVPSADPGDNDFSKPLALTDGRDRIEKFKAFQQAEKARIDNEVKLKQLIKIDDIADLEFEKWRRLRDLLLAIPSRITAKMIAAESTHASERLLNDELQSTLESIADPAKSESEFKKKIMSELAEYLEAR